MKLNILDRLPDQFFHVEYYEVNTLFDGPALICLKGESSEKPVLIATLLHGNEDSGFNGLKHYLSKTEKLPRDLYIFLGNPVAAEYQQRRLDSQLDYNRIWVDGSSVENKTAMETLDFLKDKNLFAAIDIHNSTGHSPYFTVINSLDDKVVYLAEQFSKHVLHFPDLKEVLSNAMLKLCPCITAECGKTNHPEGSIKAYEFIKQFMNLKKFPENIKNKNSHLFEVAAKIKTPSKIDFSFDSIDSPLYLDKDLDSFNLQQLEVGTQFGCVQNEKEDRLEVYNCADQLITDDFFTYEDNLIKLKMQMTPAMLTLNKKVNSQDCLGYLMKPIKN